MKQIILSFVCLFTILEPVYASFSTSKSAALTFSSHEISLGVLHGKETIISLNDAEIGFLCYVKIPLLSSYALFDFYIDCNYRNLGYGKCLLNHVMDDIHAINNNSTLYVQPGPFELIDGQFKQVQEPLRQKLIEKLVKFYRALGFKNMELGYLTRYIIYIFYILTGIHEDPKYLMVRN